MGHPMSTLQRDQPSHPEPLGEILSTWFTTRAWGRTQERMHLEKVWREVVGHEVAEQARPGRLRRGVLEVIVVDSVLHQELDLARARLLEALNLTLRVPPIRDLRFRVG
jgi:predicted nucleic acid-binding Zn ribbon protein